MKKLAFMLVLACGVFASHAEDQYLMWMFETTGWGWSTVEFDEVKIYAKDTSTAGSKAQYLTIYDRNNLGTEITVTESTSDTYATLIAPTYQSSAWSFFVEVYNDDTLVDLDLSGLTYTAAYAQYIAKDASGIANPPAVWNPGAQSVPEPNSAMLLLMGLSALALRRKRAAKKA